MNRRFSEKNLQLMRAIQGCNPKSARFLEYTDLKELALLYGLLSEHDDLLSNECLIAKRLLAEQLPEQHLESVLDLYKHI